MKKRLNFLWIDDDPKRRESAEFLQNRLKINIVFEDVQKKDLSSELRRILSNPAPDLILMDHRLNRVEKGIIETGSTVAEIVREKWPECPIVCVTAVKPANIDVHKQSIYDDLFEISRLSEFCPSLKAIANSFRVLKEKQPNNVSNLIDLLKTPSDEKDRLIAILPENLRMNYWDKSLSGAISRWVKHTLMARPGFLFDQLWTATLLGIKEKSFNKVNTLFENAKYKGIFADEGNERWWQIKLREILFSKFSENDTMFPWVLGRKLSKIKKRDYSKCFVCGKDFPEIVGYTDETAKRMEPMHLRCTIPHPNFERTLFFEEIRMMKAAI